MYGGFVTTIVYNRTSQRRKRVGSLSKISCRNDWHHFDHSLNPSGPELSMTGGDVLTFMRNSSTRCFNFSCGIGWWIWSVFFDVEMTSMISSFAKSTIGKKGVFWWAVCFGIGCSLRYFNLLRRIKTMALLAGSWFTWCLCSRAGWWCAIAKPWSLAMLIV